MHQAKNNMVTTSTNIQVDKMHEATLSNADGFTAFSFGGYKYIDLKPILDGLYIDYDSFLKPIKSVRITYA